MGAREIVEGIWPGALEEPFILPITDWRDGLRFVESAEGGPIEGRLAKLFDVEAFGVVEFVIKGGVALPDEEEVESFCLVGDLLGD